MDWLREERPEKLALLWQEADGIRRRRVGEEVHLRGLIEISNRCIRECHYCGLRAGNRNLRRYRLSADEIMACDLDYESLAAAGTMLGSGGMIVIPRRCDMVELIEVLMHFYWDESCGQCTPCREGTGWLHRIVRRLRAGQGTPGDLELLAGGLDAGVDMVAQSFVRSAQDVTRLRSAMGERLVPSRFRWERVAF